MVTKSVTIKATRFIVKDVFFDMVYWPFWWYSSGVLRALKHFRNTVVQDNDELALTVWLRNIFVPMFGDYSLQGRIISFFMRLVQLVARSLFFVLWCLVAFMSVILWLIVPVVIIYEVLFNLELVANFIWIPETLIK
jgi:hypothetical protein